MQITVDHISKTYFMNEKPVEVLRDISCDINSGDLIAITGPSGAGKSTFLHLLGTLDNPSQGRVGMGDVENIFALPPAKLAAFRNENIGFVFQFHHLLPEFTALENAMLPAKIRRTTPQAAESRAKELLAMVGLSHRIDHRPGELSGGEQQRVAIARALMNRPKILLADEPTGNLDETISGGIFDLLTNLNRELGLTIIVVTHNPRMAEKMPRRFHLGKEGLQILA